MTVVHLFTCDYCNPERSTDSDSQDGCKAWARVMGDGIPTGWWPVPEKAPDGSTGHACPSCMMARDGDAWKDVTARRQAETARLTGIDPSAP